LRFSKEKSLKSLINLSILILFNSLKFNCWLIINVLMYFIIIF
jgi:hypothetical protein